MCWCPTVLSRMLSHLLYQHITCPSAILRNIAGAGRGEYILPLHKVAIYVVTGAQVRKIVLPSLAYPKQLVVGKNGSVGVEGF